MPDDLFIPVEKKITETEVVGVTMRELSIYAADVDTGGVLAIVLAPLDETGKWRDDVDGKLVRIEDDLTSTDPQQRYAASMFQNLIFSAIVADTPTHQAMGVAGLSVWDSAKVLAPQFIAIAEAAAAAKLAAQQPAPEESE